MNEIQEALNPEQWEAVSYCEGPALVIAGAGAGKTRVLTYKIAYLLAQGVAPWQILSLTFTNKAAREMNDRIAQLATPEAVRQLWSGTFHSVFAKILRLESEHLGYTRDYTIYDTNDSRSLIKSIVKELGLDDKTYKPATIAGKISEAKNALVLPAQYIADANIRKRDEINNLAKTGRIYEIYCQRCKKSNAMDFDDLLLNTFLLFEQHPEIREKYAHRFRFILVDEYQDTNAAQHRIIRQLTEKDSPICVVGDDAQSIYAFRGAKIDNILQFQEQYPGAKLIKLERNYRSTQTIVNAANSIICHNRRQIPKKIYSDNEVGSPIKIFSAYSDKDESLQVIAEIKRLQRTHGLEWNDIALLYRTNAQSRAFEEALRTANIPYRIYGGLSFYQRKEIKDIIAYFRLVANPHDEEAFKRIVNYPARGIGGTTQSKLQLAAAEHEATLWDVASSPDAFQVEIGSAPKKKLAAFCSQIAEWRTQLESCNGSELAIRIIKESGIAADIGADNSPENLSRQENVEELLGAIKASETERIEEYGSEIVPLSEYLSQVSLLTDADQKDDGTPKVSLMTVHAAKGLEFEAVFVTGMEEDLFPNSSARLYPNEMEEERRLFYVAVTRAKRFCYLTYAKSRYKYGNMEFCSPSPFLEEIDRQYLEEMGAKSGRTLSFSPQARTAATLSAAKLRPVAPLPQTPEKTIPGHGMDENQPAQGSLKAGQIIEHERFGIGTILSVEGSGQNQKIRVRFDNAGEKNLLVKFAKFKLA